MPMFWAVAIGIIVYAATDIVAERILFGHIG